MTHSKRSIPQNTPAKRGRPTTKPEAEPIPETLENIVLAVLSTLLKEEHAWEYLQGPSR